MEHQVRIVRITDGKMDDFVSAWTAQIARLRRRFGFTIEGAWAIDETNEFIWVLGYDGDEGFAAAEKRYRESEDRLSVDDGSTEWVVDSRVHTVRKVV